MLLLHKDYLISLYFKCISIKKITFHKGKILVHISVYFYDRFISISLSPSGESLFQYVKITNFTGRKSVAAATLLIKNV